MAQASRRRKGWRRALRPIGLLIVSAFVALPTSFIGGMALTPLLWRLEPVLGMELAGHSGPSDWILATLFGIATSALFVLLLWLTRARPETPTNEPLKSAGQSPT